MADTFLFSLTCDRHGATPTVGEVDGEYIVDRQQGALIWQLPSIDSSNASGSLEFNCEGEDTENFFPVSVQFESERLICDVDVRSSFLLLCLCASVVGCVVNYHVS